MTAGPDVAVLIVTFRGLELTRDCVRSVLASRDVRLQVIVIDNASGDETAEALAREFPAITLLAEPVNRGYTGGNNAGLRLAAASGARYALILNNDTVLDPHCIARLVAAADAAQDVGLAAPQIRYHSHPELLWYGGGTFNPWTGRSTHIGRKRPASAGLPTACEVSFVTGCALLVRMAALPAVGLLDESLFGYVEDLDWSVRFRQAGHRLRYVPEAMLWHREGISHRRAGGRALQVYLAGRNQLRVLGRHSRWYQWPTIVPAFVIDHIGRFTALSILHRDPAEFAAIFRGIWHAMVGGRHPIEPSVGPDGPNQQLGVEQIAGETEGETVGDPAARQHRRGMRGDRLDPKPGLLK